MYTITFYSFKGGVGRTMALVNVGVQLAKMGRKVLLVDFDLEAPGLETFDRLRPPQPHPGLVEYVTKYRATLRAPDVRDYIYPAGSVGEKGGQLWVMPAGRRDTPQYQSDLAEINWIKLYGKEEGFLLLEDTRAQWEQEYKPDYVLIDSRTGHTDVEGICTRQLPDAVVVLFFPNEQNLVGLRDVCRRIRKEATCGLKKYIRLHFVASNIPKLDDEHDVIRRRMEAFHEHLKFAKADAVLYRYEDVMLYNQPIFVLDRPKTTLAKAYEGLAWKLIVHNRADRDGALQFLRHQYREYLAEFGLPEYVEEAGSRTPPEVADPKSDPFLRGLAPPGCFKRVGVADPAGDAWEAIYDNFAADHEVNQALMNCLEIERELLEMESYREAMTEEEASQSPEQQG